MGQKNAFSWEADAELAQGQRLVAADPEREGASTPAAPVLAC